MAINKITDAQIAQYGVQAAPNQLTGSAEENKKVFDRLIANVVAVYFNALIDALTATTGAGEIGAAVDGIEETNVLGVLAALKALRDSDSSAQGATNISLQAEIDNRYTKDQTDAMVAGKFDTAKANELVKSIAFNSDTGVFTITTQGGAVQTIDTLLEKVPASFSLVNNQLVLTLEDGTKQTADLSAFIDTYTFQSGGTIVFSQTGKNITAEVKDGSLALSKLTSEAQSTLAGYATRAEAAKEAAESAKTAAEAAKTTAQGAATTATTKANEASSSATSANNSKNAAATSATNAGNAATRAEAAATRAEKAAEEAEQAAGGDFVTNADFDAFKATTEKNLAELESTQGNSISIKSKEETLPISQRWLRIAYGNGVFVAIAKGTKTALYSKNGLNWQETSMPSSQDWCDVCFGDGKFIAIANSGDCEEAAYSVDGINWTKIAMPFSEYGDIIEYGNGKFVIIDSTYMMGMYSSDLETWTNITTLPDTIAYSNLTFGAGKFVAVGKNSETAVYSADGVTWTETNMPSAAYWNCVQYGKGVFVATVYNSTVAAYSYDGITWRSTTLPASAKWMTSIAVSEQRFVLMARDSDFAAYSDDGITWALTSMCTTATWNPVGYGGGKFVAIAYNSDVFNVSSDGINWGVNFILTDGNGEDVSGNVANAVTDYVVHSDLDYLVLRSFTPDGAKRFKITVNDSGILTATEIAE